MSCKQKSHPEGPACCINQPSGQCLLYKRDVYKFSTGIKFIIVTPTTLNSTFDFDEPFYAAVKEYRMALGDNLYISAFRAYHGSDVKRFFRIAEIARTLYVPMVVTNDVRSSS